MGWPFRKKVKLEVADPDRDLENFKKNIRQYPPTTQKCYKLFLKYHRKGTIYYEKNIYFLYQGRLLQVRR